MFRKRKSSSEANTNFRKEEEPVKKIKIKTPASVRAGIVFRAVLAAILCLIALGIYTSGFKARPKKYNESDYISDVSIADWTYGQAPNAPVAAGSFSEVAYTYEGIQGTEYKRSARVPENAGTYEVAAEIPGAPKDREGTRATTKLNINRARVSVPEIDPKVYNGSHQIASVPDSDAWTVEKNDGGTEKGSYDVILKPTGNYRWNMSDESRAREPIVLNFEITGQEEAKRLKQEKESLQAEAKASRQDPDRKERVSDASEDSGEQEDEQEQKTSGYQEETLPKAALPDDYELQERWKNTGNGWTLDEEDGQWHFILDHQAKTGWYCDSEDGNWYYFDPLTGKMLTGWQKIGGNWYYFNEDQTGQTWFKKKDGMWHYDTTTRDIHRPYGSMYADEYTPDGHYVNEAGIRAD